MSDTTEYLKVLVDGSHVPVTDRRTDHVAVLDVTRRLLIHPYSVDFNGQAAPLAQLLVALVRLDVLGGGWRLALRREAESILDLSRADPAVDANLFPGIKARAHITATPVAVQPARASWWVSYATGTVYCGVNDVGGFALAVRPFGRKVASYDEWKATFPPATSCRDKVRPDPGSIPQSLQ